MSFFAGLIIGAAIVFVLDKIKKHDDQIKELFLRLEEKDESSHDSDSLLDIIRRHDHEIQEYLNNLEK